tara:strand:+ start:123 stop:1826 length:1704 start_codon:yes stop_codon:yes gene_type:complete
MAVGSGTAWAIGTGITWAIGTGVKKYKKMKKGIKAAALATQLLADEQKAENKRLAKVLENAKVKTLEDLETTESSILADLNEFELEQTKLILSTAEQLNISVTEGLDALNTQIDSARESELNALIESGKLSMNALSEGYTNAAGKLATSQQEILANLEEKQLISRNDIISARDLAINEYDNQESKLLEDMLVSGFITKEEAEAGAASSIGGLLGFSKRAIESLSPTSLAGRRALEQQKIWTGIATEQEISDFEANYGDPTDFSRSPLYQFQLQEQEEAITRMQKARGGFLSGAGAKELLEKGSQRLAAEESQRQYARLEGLRGAGQQADRDIASTLMQAGQMAQDYTARKAENIGAIRTRAGEQLAGMGRDYADLEAGIRERYGLSIAELEVNLGREKSKLLIDKYKEKNRIEQLYTGLRLQAQAEANARRTGITEIYGSVAEDEDKKKYGIGGTARRQLGKDTAAARQGIAQNMATLRKDTRLGTASQVADIGLKGSQLSNQLALQAGDYRLQAASLPFQTFMGIANIGASLGGAALGSKGFGGSTPSFTNWTNSRDWTTGYGNYA